MSTIVFLHGIESRTDASRKPIGRKARWLESDWSQGDRMTNPGSPVPAG